MNNELNEGIRGRSMCNCALSQKMLDSWSLFYAGGSNLSNAILLVSLAVLSPDGNDCQGYGCESYTIHIIAEIKLQQNNDNCNIKK